MIDKTNQYLNEAWEVELRDMMSDAFEGNTTPEYYNNVGYAYLCSAPSSIYKYFPNNTERLRTIFNNNMWYSAPANFNDVFDCDLAINENEVFNGFISQVADKMIIRKGSTKWKELHHIVRGELKKFTETMQHVRESTGVSCFSEHYDSILMWGHYANNHKGLCIEYELLDFNRELTYTPVPVIYSNKRVCINNIDLISPEQGVSKHFLNCLTTKSPEWYYEKEWRIIRDSAACGSAWDNQKHGALLPSITPASIILGCEASDIEEEVRTYCKSKKINLFRMEKDQTEYRLIKTPVLQFNS